MNAETLVTIGLGFTGYTLFHLWSAIDHLYCLGKGKTQLKRERRCFSVRDRILLTRYVELSKYHRQTAKVLRILYWIYLVSVASICLLFVANEIWDFEKVLFAVIRSKLYYFDVPYTVFTFLMTKHHPNGGVTWRWDKSN